MVAHGAGFPKLLQQKKSTIDKKGNRFLLNAMVL